MTFKPLHSYLTGFTASVLLTLISFGLVEKGVFSGGLAVAAIMTLAFVQLLVQLLFFLHLGREGKPYWNFMAFLSTFLLIIIVIGASMWIMDNLRYRHMTPEEQTNYILQSEGVFR